MLGKIRGIVKKGKSQDVALTAAGALLFVAGRKVTGLGLFATGLYNLEQRWRHDHDFEGTFAQRWEQAEVFYEATHQDDTNRVLHIVGIPIIVAGTVGMLVCKPYRPMWAASLGAFTFGWVLNFVGHGVYEKKAPAFADDPFSFVAGPIWDMKQFKNGFKKSASMDPHAAAE